MLKTFISIWTIFFLACTANIQNPNTLQKKLDIQGHRGARGLMPENTLPAFSKALELGVNTLEMDLVISSDRKVLVSHEPYFRSVISLQPDGSPISKEDELSFNMFQMTYDSIKKFDVGSAPDPKHPERENVPTYRPLFSEVVSLTKSYCEKHNKALPDFNIEIKRLPEYDDIYHPKGQEFVDLVLDQVRNLGIENNVIIQSFDLESLQLTRA